MVFFIFNWWKIVNELLKDIDILIIIDIEATCWQGNPPPGQEMEIIEIGICPFDLKTRKRLSKRSIFIKPEKSKVSDYCTQLTSLTQAQINTGISLKEACGILEKEYSTRKRTWASWGDYDRRQFMKECEAKNVPYPFSEKHINIKQLFATERGLARAVELEEALQSIGLKFEGTYHRAIDDAFNIALVFSNLLSEKGA